MGKRKNYLINKRFQINFIFKFIVLIVLESALILGLFMYVSKNTLTTGYAGSILKIERTQNFFFVPFIFITLIVVVGVAIVALVVFTLLSHRIAGPLYRFEKVLKQMEEGDFTGSINLRKTDQLVEFREALNNFMNSLDKRMGSIKDGLKDVESLLSKGDDPQVISELNKSLSLIKKEINHFKVTSDLKSR
ncbi:MAG: methyl-accepting chemotaxis protein [Candidatus Omnitrophica bacterium]|nr:methyl-accepting chemotaxis protein [Candidatus Omnitrophota bacterium]